MIASMPPTPSYLPGVFRRTVELHDMKYAWTEVGRECALFSSAYVACVYPSPVGSCCAMRRSCGHRYCSVILANSSRPHLQSYMLAALDCLPMSPHPTPPWRLPPIEQENPF